MNSNIVTNLSEETGEFKTTMLIPIRISDDKKENKQTPSKSIKKNKNNKKKKRRKK